MLSSGWMNWAYMHPSKCPVVYTGWASVTFEWTHHSLVYWKSLGRQQQQRKGEKGGRLAECKGHTSLAPGASHGILLGILHLPGCGDLPGFCNFILCLSSDNGSRNRLWVLRRTKCKEGVTHSAPLFLTGRSPLTSWWFCPVQVRVKNMKNIPLHFDCYIFIKLHVSIPYLKTLHNYMQIMDTNFVDNYSHLIMDRHKHYVTYQKFSFFLKN